LNERCDVLVVGGGIHGVGVAQAAAAAGYSAILVEQRGLASGTSSRSSKLIHGGLRYLESGELGLVWECLRERRIMVEVAPDLVRMEQFYLPLYRQGRRYQWQLLTGLSLYALLAGFRPGTGFARLGPDAVDPADGLLREDLKAIFRYQDARTDDRELTRAVMASAVNLGARLMMPAEFVSAEIRDDGVHARCRQPGGEVEIASRVLVNATGPWAAELIGRIRPAPPPVAVELIQGSHLVFRDWHVRRNYYLENPRDGRGVFVLPWPGGTLVGTTETRFEGDPATVRPRPSERRYLLSVVRHYFPDTGPRDLSNTTGFAGLRVLPSGSGHAFHRSRETRFETDRKRRPRVLSIFGGKLTAWRATAEKVIERIGDSLPERQAVADTARLRLDPVGEDWPGD